MEKYLVYINLKSQFKKKSVFPIKPREYWILPSVTMLDEKLSNMERQCPYCAAYVGLIHCESL